jgi:hypothetical protein
MRKLLPLLFLLGSASAFGQEFRCVVPGEDRFYLDGSMLGLRIIDSETVAEGILHHFHQDLRPVEVGDPSGCFQGPDCSDFETESVFYTTQGASWLGTSMLEQPDGFNLFFNKNGDTIRVNTLANMGESWAAFLWGDTAHLEASVSAIGTENVMGSAQMVKTITLQAVDSDGNPIAHPLNGVEWKLSQFDGLVQTHALYWFPDFPDPSLQEAYNCVESYYPDHEHYSDALIAQTIQRPLTEGRMYDFEIGDEVQMREVMVGWPEGVWYSLYTVTAKEFSNNALTVTFSVDTYNAATQAVSNTTEVISSEDTSHIFPNDILPGLGGFITGEETGMPYLSHEIMDGQLILNALVDACHLKCVQLIEPYNLGADQSCGVYYSQADGSYGDMFHLSGIPFPVMYQSGLSGAIEQVPVYVNTSTCQFGNRKYVGIDEHEQTLLLHPNPTTSSLRFDAKAPSAYSITDMVGPNRAARHGTTGAERGAGGRFARWHLPDPIGRGRVGLKVREG